GGDRAPRRATRHPAAARLLALTRPAGDLVPDRGERNHVPCRLRAHPRPITSHLARDHGQPTSRAERCEGLRDDPALGPELESVGAEFGREHERRLGQGELAADALTWAAVSSKPCARGHGPGDSNHHFVAFTESPNLQGWACKVFPPVRGLAQKKTC